MIQKTPARAFFHCGVFSCAVKRKHTEDRSCNMLSMMKRRGRANAASFCIDTGFKKDKHE
jgi:glutamate synthase domain-containing protein 1